MDKRPFHFLKPNVHQIRPENVIFFDTETKSVPIGSKEDRQELRLGWAAYLEHQKVDRESSIRWCFFSTKEAFWSFVNECIGNASTLYIIAHNIAFDWRIVGGFQHADDSGWKLKQLYHRNMTTLISYQAKRCAIHLLDTGNFFAVSLEEVGEIVGLRKLEVDFESCDDETLSAYCRRDVEILIKAWSLWLDFLDKHELGDFKHTLPSQAFVSYRHRFMPHRIGVHDDMELCELEREAYKGARTEVFVSKKFETGSYYQLDVNSMYGFQMQSQLYPRLLRRYGDHLEVEWLETLLNDFAMIARIEVETDLPVFPLKWNRTNAYPVGRFEATLTTPELLFALKHCNICEIKEWACYSQERIFEEYATYFMSLKQRYEEEGNFPFRSIAKMFSNSLYGKFGQRGLEIRFDCELPPGAPDEVSYFNHNMGQWCRIYRLGNHTIFESTGGESFNSFPAIPAHVAAYARMYLWKLICKAGYANTFYSDTDCLVVNQAGYDNLVSLLDPQKPGYLKVEAEGTELEISAAKDYHIGNKTRMKGIRKNARQLSPGVFEQDQFLGLRGSIKKGNPDLVTVEKVHRTLHRRIRSGTLQEDGRVTPFKILPERG